MVKDDEKFGDITNEYDRDRSDIKYLQYPCAAFVTEDQVKNKEQEGDHDGNECRIHAQARRKIAMQKKGERSLESATRTV